MCYDTFCSGVYFMVHRLEELNVIDVQFLHGASQPTIVLIHQVGSEVDKVIYSLSTLSGKDNLQTLKSLFSLRKSFESDSLTS